MHHVPWPGRCFMFPSFVLATPNSRVSKGPGYVRNKYPWTNCLQTRYYCWSNSIQFRWSLPLCPFFPLPFCTFFFQSVSISDLHDLLTPWRTIDPRLTLLGVVSLSSTLFSLPPFFFYPVFMQPDEGSPSRIPLHLLSNYHWFQPILSRNLNALFG